MRPHVNIYLYSSAKSPKAAERLKEAVGYVLEFQSKRGLATRTQTFPLCRLHRKMTRNGADLYCLEMALSRITTSIEADIYIDNAYIANAMQKGWPQAWKANGWKNATGKEVTDRENWERILTMASRMIISWHVEETHPYRNWLREEVEHNRCYVAPVQPEITGEQMTLFDQKGK
jgi:ribonuclease HI